MCPSVPIDYNFGTIRVILKVAMLSASSKPHTLCKRCGQPQATPSQISSNLQGNQVCVTMKCDGCGATWSLRRFGPAVFQGRRAAGLR